MLYGMRTLEGFRLHAIDGLIGKVRDFHFQNDTWKIRHVLADTARHFAMRHVLLEPSKLGPVDWVSRAIRIRQTRDEIRHDPSLRTDLPLYRRVEEKALNYYAWAPHWTPFSGMPEPDPDFRPDEECILRSRNHLAGYHVLARDGEAGRLEDFILDDTTWEVRMAVVRIGDRGERRSVLVPVGHIEEISFDQRSIQLDFAKAALSNGPVFDPIRLSDPHLEKTVRAHYDLEPVLAESSFQA